MNGYMQSIWINRSEVIKILQDRGYIIKNTRELLRDEFKMSRKEMYEKYPMLKDPEAGRTFQFKFAYLPEERSEIKQKIIDILDSRTAIEEKYYYYGKYFWFDKGNSNLLNYLAINRCANIVRDEFYKKILNNEE